MLKCLPFVCKISILNIDQGCSNKFITKNLVIIKNVYLDWRCAREDSFEVEVLEESRVCAVESVRVSLVVGGAVARYFQVRVWSSTVVSLAQVVRFNHVHADQTLVLHQQLLLQHVKPLVVQLLAQLQVLAVYCSHLQLERLNPHYCIEVFCFEFYLFAQSFHCYLLHFRQQISFQQFLVKKVFISFLLRVNLHNTFESAHNALS
jgi:hypothetical protein